MGVEGNRPARRNVSSANRKSIPRVDKKALNVERKQHTREVAEKLGQQRLAREAAEAAALADDGSDDEEDTATGFEASPADLAAINNQGIADSDDDSDDSEIYDPATARQAAKERNKRKLAPGQILVILDLASLETVKTKKGEYQLLNCDDHISLIRRFKKDPSDYRPDIIHQELMAVLDSPLNKSGRVKLLVRSEKNVLFEVSPSTRIPRTFKRFSGLMVQLLHRLKIRSADGKDMLLKVIKNPISRHIPAGAKCIAFTHAGQLQSPEALVKRLPVEDPNVPLVLIFGAQATRGIVPEEHPYIEELVSISGFPLSGVVAINRVLGSIETKLGIY